jgi:uracil-DNA glycosylase
MVKKSVSSKQKALEKIAQEIAHCKVCQKDKVGVSVPGEGNADADVMFVGEAPGKEEAKTGRPFIGRAGKLLRGLIAEAGLKDEQVFITSPVKYLPKHVTPTPEEVAHGRTHLFEQIAVIEPKVIVLLGRVAALAVLERNILVAKEHGKVIEQEGKRYLLAYHPAAPLYAPKVKTEIIKDFKKLKTLIKKT